jgi:serine/threonine protein kinase
VIGNRLGEGAFGRVKEAVHIRNLERVAIKIMKVKRSTLTQLNSTHVRAHTRNHARMHVWWWR